MKRRQFITGTAASLLTACQDYRSWLDVPPWLPINVLKPAMQQGHYLRQLKQLPPAQGERRVDTLIIGSGVAGLTAAWRLQQQGYHNFLLLMGGETFGNANAGQWQDVPYPRGGHYLPLPTLESTHIREMLAAWQIIEKDTFSLTPTYDELSLVHAPDERILINQQWHEGLLAYNHKNSQDQQQRFFKLMNDYQQQRGNDGKPVFTIPLASCSMDETWRTLDKLTFSQWLTQQGFNDTALRWYLDYACKDDYGLD
ncbi:MAG TPA: NAD(P)-binding protein, partial [Agitococcus sp.]|nr:NAD(P)-binding protein [Agitococcus sp.]